MNTESPETQIESKPEIKAEIQEEKEILSLDEVRKLGKGEIELESLTPEQQKYFHEKYVLEENLIPDEEVIPEPEIKEPVKSEQPESKIEKPEGNFVPGDKYFKKATEANDFKQKLESAQKRIAELEKLKIETKQKRTEDEDVYSEEFLKSQKNRIDSMEAKQNAIIESEKTALENNVKELKHQKLMYDINLFQMETPELKTSKPFHVLNSAYEKFQNDIGGPENREKFFTDPEFRKSVENQGLVFPIAEDDFAKYSKIIQVHHYKNEKGFPDIDSAFYKWKKEHGQVGIDPIKEASIEAAQRATQKFVENRTETITLPPDGGTSKGDGGMTAEQAEAWLDTHPTPTTKEERKIQAYIIAKFGGTQ